MKKVFKFIIYSATVVLGLGLLLYFLSSPIINKLVSDKLAEKRIAGIYQIEFKNAYFNIFTMGINITGVSLKPDSSQKIQELYKFQKNIALVQIKRISLIQLDIVKFVKENKIQIKKIKFIKPSVELYKNKHYAGPPPKKQITSDYENQLKEIRLNEIIIKDLSFTFCLDEKKNTDLTINKVNLNLIEPVVDLSKMAKPYDAISFQDLKIELKDIAYEGPKSLYELKLESIQYDYKKNLITLYNISINPNLNKEKFAKKHVYQTDRFEASLSSISIKDFDMNRFVKKHIISISSVDLNKLELEVYRDKNHPFNKNKFPKLPQSALSSAKQKFEIGTINLEQSRVIYMEKAENAKKAGKLEFADMLVQISNFGNTATWQENKNLKVHLQTKIYGKGLLDVHLDFPLKSNTFYINGKMGKFKMTHLNAISVSNAGINIKDGLVNKMDFNASLSNHHSSGTLNLYYQDLEISILKKQKKSGLIKDSKLLNFIANKIYLPKQNPNKKGMMYHGQIYYERDINKGVLNYIWKSIFSGLKDTIMKGNKKNDANKAEKMKRKKRKRT